MAILPAYQNENGPLQSGLGNYTVSNVLAANVPEILTVPTDETGALARYVTFGKAVAADFYAQCFSTADSVDRVTGGTFAAMVTNGTFTTDTGWTKGAGWTIGAGVATATGAISTALSQTAPVTLIAGYTYTITYDVTQSAGTVTPSIGGTAGTARSTSATFTETIICGATQILAFTGAGFSGTIDNVIVTAWVLGAGWTTDNVTAIATGTISTPISQTITTALPPLVPGQSYMVTFTITRSSGSIAASLGGGSAGTSRSSSATFSEPLIAGSTQVISFATTGFTGTLDTISVLPAASVPIDATAGVSPEQNPVGYFLNHACSTISIVSAGTPTITANFYK